MNQPALQLKILSFTENRVVFRVEYQRYRRSDFYCNRRSFVEKMITIHSSDFPMIAIYQNGQIEFFTRGDNIEFDFKEIECSLYEYLQITEAVKAYNEKRKNEEETGYDAVANT